LKNGILERVTFNSFFDIRWFLLKLRRCVTPPNLPLSKGRGMNLALKII
jgi:hypothetical protein